MKRIVIFLTLALSLSVSFGQCDLEQVDRAVNATIAERILLTSNSERLLMLPDSTEVRWESSMGHVSYIYTKSTDGQKYVIIFRLGVLLRIIDKTAQVEYSFCDDQLFHCKYIKSEHKCDHESKKLPVQELMKISDEVHEEYKERMSKIKDQN